jgi:hypothetical protein
MTPAASASNADVACLVVIIKHPCLGRTHETNAGKFDEQVCYWFRWKLVEIGVKLALRADFRESIARR